jgi:hypothetical protein
VGRRAANVDVAAVFEGVEPGPVPGVLPLLRAGCAKRFHRIVMDVAFRVTIVGHTVT